MKAKLKVGDEVHGFAGGAFGRDSYACRKVEAVGPDWIVTRNPRDEVEFTTYLYFDPEDRRYCEDFCVLDWEEDE